MAENGDLRIATRKREQMIDITREVEAVVQRSGVTDGICEVYVPHTTCAITINEGADPDVQKDFLAHMAELVPRQQSWAHAEGNSDAHIKAILVGASQGVLVNSGQLRLGRWQAIFLCEFDGPRERQVWVQVR